MSTANTDQQRFDQAMKKILTVSKAELQRRLEAEKENKHKRESKQRPGH